ncbi:MAG: hypothetical protein LBK53_09550 [Heliobacteriaceae bacterium]|nr:hypothetical protein [Heliobacteriaceae bacterium]
MDEITDGSSPADTTITFDWEKSVPIPPPAGETGNWYRGVLHNDLLKAYGPNLTSSEKANVYDELSKANAYKEGNTTVIPNYAKGETSQQHTIKLPVIEGLPTPDPKLITPQDYKTETGKGGGNKNAEYERDITNTPIKTTKFIATYTDINGRVFTNSFDNEIDAEKYIQQLDDKVYIKKRIKEE